MLGAGRVRPEVVLPVVRHRPAPGDGEGRRGAVSPRAGASRRRAYGDDVQRPCRRTRPSCRLGRHRDSPPRACRSAARANRRYVGRKRPREDTMAEPVPAGSDVSAGTYKCTNCGYELQVGSAASSMSTSSCRPRAFSRSVLRRVEPSSSSSVVINASWRRRSLPKKAISARSNAPSRVPTGVAPNARGSRMRSSVVASGAARSAEDGRQPSLPRAATPRAEHRSRPHRLSSEGAVAMSGTGCRVCFCRGRPTSSSTFSPRKDSRCLHCCSS